MPFPKLLAICCGVTFIFGWQPGADAAAQADQPTSMGVEDNAEYDSFLWLEDVEGEAALEWVSKRNQRTEATLGAGERYESLYV